MSKQMSSKKAIGFNIIWSVIAVIVNAGISFWMTPYVTNHIGVDAYGFITLSNTLISYIDVVAIALNAFAGRYISIAYHQKDYVMANRYFNSVIVSNIIFAFIIFIPCSLIVFRLNHILNISPVLASDVKILFFLVLVRYSFSIIGTAYNVATFIRNRLSLSERQKCIGFLLQAAVLVGSFSLFQAHVWYVGLATLVMVLYTFLFSVHYTHRLTRHLHFNPRAFQMKEVKELLSLGMWNAFNNLGNVLNSGLDLVITNLMLSDIVMGQMSIGQTLGTLFNTVLEAITNAFRPKMLKLYANGQKRDLIQQIKTAMKFTGMASNLIIAGFFVCGKPFMALWVSSQDTDFVFMLAMIILLSNIIIGVVKPLYYVFTLTGKLKLPCYITIATGVLNVVFMYLLIKYTNLGAYAVVLTTMVLNYVHLVDTPLYSAYCLHVPLGTFYPVLGRHFLSFTLIAL